MNDHNPYAKSVENLRDLETKARLALLNERIRERQSSLNLLVNVAVLGLLSIAGIFAGSLLWL